MKKIILISIIFFISCFNQQLLNNVDMNNTKSEIEKDLESNKYFDSSKVITKNKFLVFETGHKSFNQDSNFIKKKYLDLIEKLKEKNVKVIFKNIKEIINEKILVDEIVIFSSNTDFNHNEDLFLKEFVKNGGRLVILGEWGGFSDFDNISINSLLEFFSIKINSNLIKSIKYSGRKQYDLIVTNINRDYELMENINEIAFYSASSLTLLDSSAISLAYADKYSYEVKDHSEGNSLIALSKYGLGRVIVISDSSLFSSFDNDNNGVINLFEKDNLKLSFNFLIM